MTKNLTAVILLNFVLFILIVTSACTRKTLRVNAFDVGAPENISCGPSDVLIGKQCIPYCNTQADVKASPFHSIVSVDNIDYYAICANEQLNLIGSNSDYLVKNYILKTDLTFVDPSPVGTNFTPIGDHRNALPLKEFSGIFDGANHSISGLVYEEVEGLDIGLFRRTNGATIKNLKIKEVRVQGNQTIGGLVGFAVATKFINSSVSGSVKGTDKIGGLVGHSQTSTFLKTSNMDLNIKGTSSVGGIIGFADVSSLTDSLGSSPVIGTEAVGGLVGHAINSDVVNSSVTSEVKGTGDVGGLVGFSDNSRVTTSCSKGSVIGTGAIGGLVGLQKNNSTIAQSYSIASVKGTQNVGGLSGMSFDSIILNTYSNGAVGGTSTTGGLIGAITNTSISKTYSIGKILGWELTGGLIGKQEDSLSVGTEIYWDMEASEQTNSAFGSGKTTGEMKSVATYAGWDPTIWNLVEGAYPSLIGVCTEQ